MSKDEHRGGGRPPSRQGGADQRRPTANQEKLERSIATFARQCPFGDGLLRWLRASDVTIVRAARSPYSRRWDLHLILPERLGQMFDIDLEMLCLAADFKKIEPRILDELQQSLHKLDRVDDELAVLVSSDPSAEKLTSRRPGQTAVLAVDAARLADRSMPDFPTALAGSLLTVDHFNVTTPLTDPSSFFGRDKDIEDALQCLSAGQHLGIFGLRKSGKSSLLNQVERVLDDRGWAIARVDLNAYVGRSERMSEDLVRRLRGSAQRLQTPVPPLRSTRGNIEQRWIEDLEALVSALANVAGILLIVDEIDTVLPGRVESAGGVAEDRRKMLRALVQLRAMIQDTQTRQDVHPVLFSAGVDATIFELPRLTGGDNPLYQFSRVKFLEPLDRAALQRMVRILGKRSGMRFADHRLAEELAAEYGGHPLLTRQACSWVHRHRPANTVPYPVTLDALHQAFTARGTGTPLTHAHDTLDELAQWYPDDGALLVSLLAGGSADVGEMQHAVDYGLVDADGLVRMRALMRRA